MNDLDMLEPGTLTRADYLRYRSTPPPKAPDTRPLCVVCGTAFTPPSARSATCVKPSCRRARTRAMARAQR